MKKSGFAKAMGLLFCLVLIICALSGCGGRKKLPAEYVAQFAEGKTVTFGNYAGEPIEWLVLKTNVDMDGTKTCVMISVKGLDAVCFNKSEDDGNEWADSYIRTWLNGTFYDSAFSKDEKEVITAGPTNDYVWLLSVEEAEQYFADDDARLCYPTQNAVDNGAWTSKNGAGWWWLRSPGSNSIRTADVYDKGYVRPGGFDVRNGNEMARPVVCVSLGLLS